MIMKNNKQIGFIYKNNESIDKILNNGDVVFEKGFLRELTSTTLPITFGGVGKDLKDYRIYGNTYQKTTSGKNLLKTTLYNTVKQGITTSYDSEDGALVLNGTATTTYSDLTANSSLNLQPGEYIFSLKEIKPYSVQLRITYSDDTTYSRTIPNNTKSISVNLTKTTKEQRVFIYENSTLKGTIFTNEKLYVQLENGGTATDFEPYTNGASPNTDYPQKIISCGDRTRNLFDKTNATYKNGYYKNDNGVEQITQTSGYLTSYIPVKPNATYTIQGKLKNTNSPTHAYAIYYYNDSKQWISRVVITDNPPYTFTTPNDCYFIQFQYRQDVYDENTIQIEEGSTATSYEPYGYKIPITTKGNNIISQTVYQTGKNLRADGIILDNSNYYIVKQTNLKPLSKYMLSENQNYVVTGSGTSMRVNAYDENDNFISNLVDDNRTEVKRYTHTFTVPLNTSYVLIGFRNTDTNIELVEYKDATIYLSEPLRKIDEYTDYIDFKNGKVVRNINEIVLDGSEYWNKVGGTTNSFYHPSRIGTYDNNKKWLISDYYISVERTNIDNTKNYITMNSDGNIRINNINITTANNFETWLSQNNTTVDYILPTPAEETITLPNIPTIDGNNTLNIDTEITPSQVYIKYKSNV